QLATTVAEIVTSAVVAAKAGIAAKTSPRDTRPKSAFFIDFSLFRETGFPVGAQQAQPVCPVDNGVVTPLLSGTSRTVPRNSKVIGDAKRHRLPENRQNSAGVRTKFSPPAAASAA